MVAILPKILEKYVDECVSGELSETQSANLIELIGSLEGNEESLEFLTSLASSKRVQTSVRYDAINRMGRIDSNIAFNYFSNELESIETNDLVRLLDIAEEEWFLGSIYQNDPNYREKLREWSCEFEIDRSLRRKAQQLLLTHANLSNAADKIEYEDAAAIAHFYSKESDLDLKKQIRSFFKDTDDGAQKYFAALLPTVTAGVGQKKDYNTWRNLAKLRNYEGIDFDFKNISFVERIKNGFRFERTPPDNFSFDLPMIMVISVLVNLVYTIFIYFFSSGTINTENLIWLFILSASLTTFALWMQDVLIAPISLSPDRLLSLSFNFIRSMAASFVAVAIFGMAFLLTYGQKSAISILELDSGQGKIFDIIKLSILTIFAIALIRPIGISIHRLFQQNQNRYLAKILVPALSTLSILLICSKGAITDNGAAESLIVIFFIPIAFSLSILFAIIDEEPRLKNTSQVRPERYSYLHVTFASFAFLLFIPLVPSVWSIATASTNHSIDLSQIELLNKNQTYRIINNRSYRLGNSYNLSNVKLTAKSNSDNDLAIYINKEKIVDEQSGGVEFRTIDTIFADSILCIGVDHDRGSSKCEDTEHNPFINFVHYISSRMKGEEKLVSDVDLYVQLFSISEDNSDSHVDQQSFASSLDDYKSRLNDFDDFIANSANNLTNSDFADGFYVVTNKITDFKNGTEYRKGSVVYLKNDSVSTHSDNGGAIDIKHVIGIRSWPKEVEEVIEEETEEVIAGASGSGDGSKVYNLNDHLVPWPESEEFDKELLATLNFISSISGQSGYYWSIDHRLYVNFLLGKKTETTSSPIAKDRYAYLMFDVDLNGRNTQENTSYIPHVYPILLSEADMAGDNQVTTIEAHPFFGMNNKYYLEGNADFCISFPNPEESSNSNIIKLYGNEIYLWMNKIRDLASTFTDFENYKFIENIKYVNDKSSCKSVNTVPYNVVNIDEFVKHRFFLSIGTPYKVRRQSVSTDGNFQPFELGIQVAQQLDKVTGITTTDSVEDLSIVTRYLGDELGAVSVIDSNGATLEEAGQYSYDPMKDLIICIKRVNSSTDCNDQTYSNIEKIRWITSNNKRPEGGKVKVTHNKISHMTMN